MSVALEERPTAPPAARGGGAGARRAIFRWSRRLFRREWRQQVLVLALMVFAVAATTVGVALAYNAAPPLNTDFGSANTRMDFPGSNSAGITAVQKHFAPVEEIAHQTIAIPGSLEKLDVRAQDPHGTYSSSTLRLLTGRYPTGAGDIAMTKSAAAVFDLLIGDRFVENGRARHLVGLVENPLNLNDEFALVAPGQADPPTQVSLLFDASSQQVNAFQSGRGATAVELRGNMDTTTAAVVVLALETIGLLFVGLVAAAGFAVMAQRRMRALGMLGAIGATDRQVRFAMLANGAVVGIAGSILGAALGFVSWIALAPHLATLASHRVNLFHVPWWAIGAAMALAVVTAIGAAWWPARSVARAPIVSALSARPAPPKPAHRFAAVGAVFLLIGLLALAFAHPANQDPKPWLIIGGTLSTTFGMLFLGPLFIRALAAAGTRAPIALRLALRDLARYQARSAAALGAISLALAIAATVAVSAAAVQAPQGPTNLPASEIAVYLGTDGSFTFVSGLPAIPQSTPSQARATRARVDALAASLGARAVIPLTAAVDPASGTFQEGGPGGPGPIGGGAGKAVREITGTGSGAAPAPGTGDLAPVALGRVTAVSHGRQHGIEIDDTSALYVATPAVLAHYGIKAGAINANADLVTSLTRLGGRVVIAPLSQTQPCSAQPNCRVHGKQPNPNAAPLGPFQWTPTTQTVEQLPAYTSDPGSLLTTHALHAYGLRAVPAGWLIETKAPLTTAQVDAAQRVAGAAGLTIEKKHMPSSNAKLRDVATAVGLLVALGVLAMTVGLIRSETANDLRTLAATGATSTTRRTLTGATAGALALLGALLGTGGAYAALLAWYRSDLHPLTHVPYVNLAVIVVGLPLIAVAAGWLLAGREPATIGHQPLD